MDAEAVKFNLDRNRTDARSNLKADLASIASVEVASPTEVRIKLNQPDAALPAILTDRAGMMISPKAVKEFGAESDRKPVGAGPWKFVSWSDNDKIVLTRNEAYWKPNQPYTDGVEILIIPDQATGLRSVTSGQNHMIYNLSSRYKPLVDKAKNLTLATSPTLYCFQVYFNYSRAPLDNVKVRQAINHAIDRTAFLRATLGGVGEPAYMLHAIDALGPRQAGRGAVSLRPGPREEAAGRGGHAERAGDHDGQLQRPGLGAARRSHHGDAGQGRHTGQADLWLDRGNLRPVLRHRKEVRRAAVGLDRQARSQHDLLARLRQGRVLQRRPQEASPELTALLQESRVKEDLEFRKQVFSKIQRM